MMCASQWNIKILKNSCVPQFWCKIRYNVVRRMPKSQDRRGIEKAVFSSTLQAKAAIFSIVLEKRTRFQFFTSQNSPVLLLPAKWCCDPMRCWSLYLFNFSNSALFTCHISKDNIFENDSWPDSGSFKMNPVINIKPIYCNEVVYKWFSYFWYGIVFIV